MDLHAQTGIKSVPTLQTERLTLRTIRPDDAAVAVDALNHWDVTQWLTMVPFPYAQENFDWYLREMCNDPDDNIWAMEVDGDMIGVISAGGEVGYWLHPNYQGHGYMSEAARRVCAWCFARGDEILVSGYHLGNGPSRNVLRKLGFADTHISRDVTTIRGDTVDIQRMALTRADWQGHHG